MPPNNYKLSKLVARIVQKSRIVSELCNQEDSLREGGNQGLTHSNGAN